MAGIHTKNTGNVVSICLTRQSKLWRRSHAQCETVTSFAAKRTTLSCLRPKPFVGSQGPPGSPNARSARIDRCAVVWPQRAARSRRIGCGC